MPRNTADTIALILAVVVALVTLATAGALLYLTVEGSTQDVSRTADAVGRIIAVLVGALVGYMAGRRVSNGGH